MFRQFSLVGLISLVMLGGCADQVEFAEVIAEPEPQAARNDVPIQDGQDNRAEGGPRHNRSTQFNRGNSREMPSDSMPSDASRWSADREMPSDSMPSRTGKWGADREMPSREGKWGKDREMPSDGAFSRRSNGDSSSKAPESSSDE